jgi:hypothetical protein
MIMSFSRGQNAKYRPVVDAAWLAHCDREGIAPNTKGSKDKWYRGELMLCLGVSSTSDCDDLVHDFDAAMLHFAIIANDEYWINKITRNGVDVIVYLIDGQLENLSKIDGNKYTFAYARGIYEQMTSGDQLPLNIEDCTAEVLKSLYEKLNIFLRRKYRHGEKVKAENKAQPELPFNDEVPF